MSRSCVPGGFGGDSVKLSDEVRQCEPCSVSSGWTGTGSEYAGYLADRIAELEDQLAWQQILLRHRLKKVGELNTENQRLRDALIPVPDICNMGTLLPTANPELNDWFHKYKLAREQALEKET